MAPTTGELVLGALLCSALGCSPPRASTGTPGAVTVTEAEALQHGQAALRSRCWRDAEWKVVWWAERQSWAVWCTMEDDETYAECSARVDPESGEVKVARLCTSTSWD